MKSCADCTHADWHRTAAGKLRPSGDGKCKYPYKLPPLPASMTWGWSQAKPPAPSGGYINRRTELPERCVYWAQKETRS